MSDITTAIRDREASLRHHHEVRYLPPDIPQWMKDVVWNIAWAFSQNLGSNALASNYQFVLAEIRDADARAEIAAMTPVRYSS